MFTKKEKEIFKKAGRIGGKMIKEKYGMEHYKKMAQLSVESRKKTKQGAVDNLENIPLTE